MNPLEKKPNGDFLEIEKYQKVNQKRLKNKVYKRVKETQYEYLKERDLFVWINWFWKQIFKIKKKRAVHEKQGRFFEIILIVYRKKLTKFDKAMRSIFWILTREFDPGSG